MLGEYSTTFRLFGLSQLLTKNLLADIFTRLCGMCGLKHDGLGRRTLLLLRVSFERVEGCSSNLRLLVRLDALSFSMVR